MIRTQLLKRATMASTPDFDELLDEPEDSQAFEADDEPEFTPTPDDSAGVVVEEPPLMPIGRKRRRDDLRKLQN